LSLDSDDFRRSAIETIKEELRGGLWPVWQKYELVPGHEGSASARFIIAPSVYRPDPLRWSTESVKVVWNELVTTYRPLVDSPELFLEFARLADDEGLDAELGTDHNASVALAWAETYGVLGLTPTQGQEFSKPAFDLFHGEGQRLSILDLRDSDSLQVVVADGTAESVLKITHITTQHTHGRRREVQGGPGDTVEAFALEAWTANAALRLYEAATGDTQRGIETIRRFRDLVDSPPGCTSPSSFEESKEWALKWVRNAAVSRTRGDAYSWSYETEAQGFEPGTRFESLLGAAWLQMLWLLNAGNNVRKCALCSKVITFESPMQQETPGTGKPPGRKYKTRVDKEFCSHNCASKHS
jgi:hypothetical protein